MYLLVLHLAFQRKWGYVFFSWVPHDRENEKSHQMEAVMGLGIQKRGTVGVVGKPEECVSQSVLMGDGLFLS